jgi:hypothetical protein
MALAAMVMGIACVPFAVFAVISGQVAASSWALLGGVTALQALMIGGRWLSFLSVGLVTALTPIAIVSGTVPVAGAALMAIMCFGVGLSASQGLHRGLMLIPAYFAFFIIAPPPWSGLTAAGRTSTSYLLWNMLFFGGGALWAALVFPPLLRRLKVQLPPRLPLEWAVVVPHTITITVLCTASTLGVLIWAPGSNGAWLVLTVLVVTQYADAATTLKRTWARVAGTVVGVGIAAILASVISTDAVLIGMGLVLTVILLVIALGPHSYFLWTVVVTPQVILFTSSSITDVPTTDAQRLAFTLIGVALILIASWITLWWTRYQRANGT